MGVLEIIKLGKMEYGEALAIQENLLGRRQKDEIGDSLLLVEHFPVLTVGRNGDRANILATPEELSKAGASVFDVSRGGDVTYHGTGQLTGYPILHLDCCGKDIRRFTGLLQETFIRLLEMEYGISSSPAEGKYTGVWVGNSKITAIGIAVKRWVTMHGFAFNINTDLTHFRWIVPCGLVDRGVTSLEKLTGAKQDFWQVANKVAEYFCEVFVFERKGWSYD